MKTPSSTMAIRIASDGEEDEQAVSEAENSDCRKWILRVDRLLVALDVDNLEPHQQQLPVGCHGRQYPIF